MIKYLILHCLATPEGREFTKAQIRKWFRERGWVNDGYNLVIHLDGKVSVLQPFDTDDVLEAHEMANGAKGYNKFSIHIAYVGGTYETNINRAKDTRTPAQKESLIKIIKYLILIYPNIKIIGHNQVSTKECPSFDVPKWLETICIDTKHIEYKVNKLGIRKTLEPFDRKTK